jgi:hypothetical protein
VGLPSWVAALDLSALFYLLLVSTYDFTCNFRIYNVDLNNLSLLKTSYVCSKSILCALDTFSIARYVHIWYVHYLRLFIKLEKASHLTYCRDEFFTIFNHIIALHIPRIHVKFIV